MRRILWGLLLSLLAFPALAQAPTAGILLPNLSTAAAAAGTDLLYTTQSGSPFKQTLSAVDVYIESLNLANLGSASTARTNLGLGTSATVNTGTSGSTLCLVNANCTFSGTVNFTGTFELNGTTFALPVTSANGGTGLSSPTANALVITNGPGNMKTLAEVDGDCAVGAGGVWTTSSACGSSGGTPGGTNGQIQYNNSSAFGGFTMSGDATIVTSTGVLTIAANAVTYAKLQQVGANDLVGNATGSLANATNIGLASCLTFSGTNLATTVVDNTSTANYTIAALDMCGQRNMNATSLTLTIPAISSTIFAAGMSATIDYQASTGSLTVTTTPTINGMPCQTKLYPFGWWSGVSNGTSIDAVGFPGFNGISANTIIRYSNDTCGALNTSALSDNGTVVSSSEPVDVTSQQVVMEVANDGTTGTTQSKLAKLNSAGTGAIIAGTSDTDGQIGVVISAGSGVTTGNAQIAFAGTVNCIFDGSTTAGDWVIISSSVAGDCKDSGSASRPTATQAIGRVIVTHSGASTQPVVLAIGFLNTSGGGSGTVNSGTAGQMAYYAASAAAVSGNANANISGGALTLGTAGSTVGTLVLVNATSGSITLATPSGALGTRTATFPANTGTLAELNLAQTWTAAQTFGTVNGTTTTQSGTTYTLASTDCGTTVQFTSSSSVTVTIPNTLLAGCSIAMEQQGDTSAAAVSITGSAVTPATLHKAFTNGTTRVQYSVIGITIESGTGSNAVAVMWGDGA